ncbi:MAG TPA: hypothetical protein VMR98_05445 [Candidatus Polarisedimenticolaceae bacterium]|nr:hypothetical protein [Candidatus Polarisedimenticolaceae bacterium]
MSTSAQQWSNSGLYSIEYSSYCDRHYIKTFEKRYNKKVWGITQRAITAVLQRADAAMLTTKLETIHENDGHKIAKLEFAVAGRQESAKTSGNRAIVYINEELRSANVLLVYSKNEICAPNETQKWQKEIQENHFEIWSLFSRKN